MPNAFHLLTKKEKPHDVGHGKNGVEQICSGSALGKSGYAGRICTAATPFMFWLKNGGQLEAQRCLE